MDCWLTINMLQFGLSLAIPSSTGGKDAQQSKKTCFALGRLTWRTASVMFLHAHWRVKIWRTGHHWAQHCLMGAGAPKRLQAPAPQWLNVKATTTRFSSRYSGCIGSCRMLQSYRNETMPMEGCDNAVWNVYPFGGQRPRAPQFRSHALASLAPSTSWLMLPYNYDWF